MRCAFRWSAIACFSRKPWPCRRRRHLLRSVPVRRCCYSDGSTDSPANCASGRQRHPCRPDCRRHTTGSSGGTGGSPGWALPRVRCNSPRGCRRTVSAGFAAARCAWPRRSRRASARPAASRRIPASRRSASPACGFKAYPRVSPVCIGLVRRGDSVLLARSPHFPPGIYSALAGFVEPGESAEACLRREIREEAGIEIANPRWFGSQAWPYPHSLMMGFLADHAAGEPVPQAGEIEDVRWFPLAALPPLPHPSTIAFRMIAALRAGSGG
ncbi:MAG: NAD(+) diphosphatase [Proteobacteria bacterium]|nr:NAD(+) diphosphatase [Pseudomonadota bacterium]